MTWGEFYGSEYVSNWGPFSVRFSETIDNLLEKESIYLSGASTEIIKNKNNGCYYQIYEEESE